MRKTSWMRIACMKKVECHLYNSKYYKKKHNHEFQLSSRPPLLMSGMINKWRYFVTPLQHGEAGELPRALRILCTSVPMTLLLPRVPGQDSKTGAAGALRVAKFQCTHTSVSQSCGVWLSILSANKVHLSHSLKIKRHTDRTDTRHRCSDQSRSVHHRFNRKALTVVERNGRGGGGSPWASAKQFSLHKKKTACFSVSLCQFLSLSLFHSHFHSNAPPIVSFFYDQNVNRHSDNLLGCVLCHGATFSLSLLLSPSGNASPPQNTIPPNPTGLRKRYYANAHISITLHALSRHLASSH